MEEKEKIEPTYIHSVDNDVLNKILTLVVAGTAESCPFFAQFYYWSYYASGALTVRSVCKRWRLVLLVKLAQTAFSVCTDPKACMINFVRYLDSKQEQAAARQRSTGIVMFPKAITKNYDFSAYLNPKNKRMVLLANNTDVKEGDGFQIGPPMKK